MWPEQWLLTFAVGGHQGWGLELAWRFLTLGRESSRVAVVARMVVPDLGGREPSRVVARTATSDLEVRSRRGRWWETDPDLHD